MKLIRRLDPRRAAIALFIGVVALFATVLGTAATSTHAKAAATPAAPTCSTANPCVHGGNVGDVDHGLTKGWLNGRTVTFDYTRNYFCADPPTSGSKTHCEAGAAATIAPKGMTDPLYVIVPLGFTPAASTLQCAAGTCVDHPGHIDLSRVFMTSADSNVVLPAHSHVVTTANQGAAEWWQIVVVGVTSQSAWDGIVSGKSITAVQSCQTAGACTGDVPSNLYLYFSVK